MAILVEDAAVSRGSDHVAPLVAITTADDAMVLTTTEKHPAPAAGQGMGASFQLDYAARGGSWVIADEEVLLNVLLLGREPWCMEDRG